MAARFARTRSWAALLTVLALHMGLLLPQFRVAARTDSKTGLVDASFWHDVAEREIARARRLVSTVGVLILDLDHFKQINDTFGHRTGDVCLRAVIAPIAGELRLGDAFGRWGGEEFLAVLPGADAQDACVVAERIRACIEQLPLMVSGSRIGLTLSIGIAALDEGVATPEQLIEGADTALYRAKASGRNRVCVHDFNAVAEPGAETTA
jgi:diguanylate cyclase (GGDEF)-like protein